MKCCKMTNQCETNTNISKIIEINIKNKNKKKKIITLHSKSKYILSSFSPLVRVHKYMNIIGINFIIFFLLKEKKSEQKYGGIDFFVETYTDSSRRNITSLDNLYDILEISSESTISEIKKAYRNLSLKWHPDKVSGKEEKKIAQMNFQNINNAYNILSDETSRNYYDVYGKDFEAMKEYFDEIIHSYNIPELYALKKNISILYRKNYEKILLNSPYIWIVTFYHPNCGSCQQNVPIITALAEVVATGDKIRVGVMNCAVSIHLCHTFNIDHMGQIVFFPPYQEANDFWDYVKYAGYNSVSNIMQHALNLSHGEIVKIDNEMYIPQQLMQPIHSSITKGLVEGIWLLEYYKVGCSPCKQLKTELNALSQTLKGTLKISTINCGEHLCNVPFYPYLKLFIKRAGSNKIETIPLKYETDGHPGALAISITGIILKDVIGLQWRRKNEKFNKIKNEKKDTHRFEEL